MIRIGLIQFPGSNCERETVLAVKRAGMTAVELMWNEPLEKFQELDGYILIGGFSYEDRSRAGIIAALQPVVEEVRRQSETGKPVLGICNGAQILVESGLVPGLPELKGQVALTENKRVKDNQILGTGFYNDWVNIRIPETQQTNAFTNQLTPTDTIHLPAAHAQGRFVMSDEHWQLLQDQGLIAFQYCDQSGSVLENFPTNPNGSIGNLAAIMNKAGNVMAIMPHPERTTNGDAIFTSMRQFIEKNRQSVLRNNTNNQVSESIHLQDQKVPQLKKFVKKPQSYQYIVQLNITDNHAMTVQNTLKRLGISVTVQRYVYWELECNSPDILKQIENSGILYCDRKEQIYSISELSKSDKEFCCLVRAKEDVTGQEAFQTLKNHYDINSLNTIQHGIIWRFTSDTANIDTLKDRILLTHIIGNPYAHECFQFNTDIS